MEDVVRSLFKMREVQVNAVESDNDEMCDKTPVCIYTAGFWLLLGKSSQQKVQLGLHGGKRRTAKKK